MELRRGRVAVPAIMDVDSGFAESDLMLLHLPTTRDAVFPGVSLMLFPVFQIFSDSGSGLARWTKKADDLAPVATKDSE